jgi:hypothetical protein
VNKIKIIFKIKTQFYSDFVLEKWSIREYLIVYMRLKIRKFIFIKGGDNGE